MHDTKELLTQRKGKGKFSRRASKETCIPQRWASVEGRKPKCL